MNYVIQCSFAIKKKSEIDVYLVINVEGHFFYSNFLFHFYNRVVWVPTYYKI